MAKNNEKGVHIHDEEVLNLLKKNPVVTYEMTREFLNISESETRKAIHRLRLQGLPICSRPQCKGYKLERDKEEIRRTISHLYSRAFSEMQVARAMEQNLDDVFLNQIEGVGL